MAKKRDDSPEAVVDVWLHRYFAQGPGSQCCIFSADRKALEAATAKLIRAERRRAVRLVRESIHAGRGYYCSPLHRHCSECSSKQSIIGAILATPPRRKGKP